MMSNGFTAAALGAGILIRYSFYAVGAFAFGSVALFLSSVSKSAPTVVDARPSFRISAPELARLPITGRVVESPRLGRAEIRQYGRLQNRDVDLAVVLVIPPKGSPAGTEFAQDMRSINLLGGFRAVMSGQHYDLENRFGEFRATEMRVDTDGRWKQCLAFRSRLDSPAAYLTGWLCDATGQRPTADNLACLLDRLVLDEKLVSAEADSFMRTRLAQRPLCQADPVTQTTDTGSRRVSSPSRWSMPNAQRRNY